MEMHKGNVHSEGGAIVNQIYTTLVDMINVSWYVYIYSYNSIGYSGLISLSVWPENIMPSTVVNYSIPVFLGYYLLSPNYTKYCSNCTNYSQVTRRQLVIVANI